MSSSIVTVHRVICAGFYDETMPVVAVSDFVEDADK